MPETWWWFELLLIPVLIAASAVFVAAEYAIVTIRTTRVEEMRQEGVPAARTLGRLKKDMNASLATTQVCITATNLLLGAVAEPAMTRLIVAALRPLGTVLPDRISHSIGLVTGLLVVTLFTVVLGELLPKALTLQYTETVALYVARPIEALRILCGPLVRLMIWMGNHAARLAGLGKVEIAEPVHSEAELEMLVDRADEAGEFHEEHGDLLRRAFDFADLNVRHVMIPLRKAATLDSSMTASEAVARLSDWPYTRWPLRDAASGRIVGVVNIKLLLHALSLEAGDVLILQDLALEPTYLDPDMPLVDALTALRGSRRHLAIVREEGIDLGVVTLEDILGAIVGKIPSEQRFPSKLKP